MKDNSLNFSEEEINKIFAGIWSGRITTRKLPKDIYYSTSYLLKKSIYKGFGGTPLDFEFGTPNFETIVELRENIYMFSAAKTYQQTRQMTDLMVGDDAVVSFSEFKKKAREIFDTFNENYLKAEYDTALGQAESAAKWNNIEKDVKLFPYLQYDAVMDANTSAICSSLEGITLPVGHPFWNTNAPLNHFRCRCRFKQISIYQDVRRTDRRTLEKTEDFIKPIRNKVFNMNPGKDKVVFPKEHPYFTVEKKDKAFAKRNFDLPIPKTDE